MRKPQPSTDREQWHLIVGVILGVLVEPVNSGMLTPMQGVFLFVGYLAVSYLAFRSMAYARRAVDRLFGWGPDAR